MQVGRSFGVRRSLRLCTGIRGCCHRCCPSGAGWVGDAVAARLGDPECVGQGFGQLYRRATGTRAPTAPWLLGYDLTGVPQEFLAHVELHFFDAVGERGEVAPPVGAELAGVPVLSGPWQ